MAASLLPALDGRYDDAGDVVRVGAESTSWSGLAARAGAVAARLAGVETVAVQASPTLDTVVAIVAGLRSGVVVVPVAGDAGPMEREHILRDSGATAVLGAPDWPDVALPRIDLADGEGDVSLTALPDTAPALVMYTSGTTGLPKGAVLSRGAIAADLDGLAAAWEWTPNDTLVHGLPLFHVHGLILGVLGALRVGSRLIHTGRPTPSAYAAARGTLYFGVPTVWSRVCADPAAARELRGARLLVSGSAPLPVPVFEQMADLTGQSPVERYGMTETLITLSTRASGERRAGHVGMPIDGVETRLVGDDGTPTLHDGESIGELQVRGATLFSSYLGQPEVTAAAFDDGWFVTGDAVTIGPDGFHRIVGRKSIDIIKSGGYKIGAGEVEGALLAHPGVSEAAVIGVADDDLGQRIVGFVVGEDLDGAALVEFVAGLLSHHKRPREVHVVDHLPRNAMGKVQKNQLMP
ncbi:MAG TPA: acyl-CoA synthetase [Ilumatobacteraceae bacterium]|nr:acyl-CoA synthetase [Ilumatobacteraceae bacterium]